MSVYFARVDSSEACQAVAVLAVAAEHILVSVAAATAAFVRDFALVSHTADSLTLAAYNYYFYRYSYSYCTAGVTPLAEAFVVGPCTGAPVAIVA